MSKILLVNPQFIENYISSARWDSLSFSNTHWYPIFLSYLCGNLEVHGHICRLIDAQAENLNDDDVSDIALNFKPDFTIIYITERGLEANLKLAKDIKWRTESKIIFVGPWVSLACDKILENEVVDFVIDGEFEYAVLDIVENRPKEMEGKRGYILAPRLTAKQLNNLDWVTKVYAKHLNINHYRVSSIKHPYVDVFTSRKCYWGKCAFCLWPVTIQEEGVYVERNIKDVLDEIEWTWKNLKIREIFIQDDTIHPKRAKELSEGLLKRNLKIKWACYARGDLLLTQEVIDIMAKSGCITVHIGLESGSNKILKKMNKGVTVESLREVVNRFNKAGIKVHGDFMVGNIGENRETVQQTFDFIKSLNGLDIVQIAPPKLYSNCQLYKWYEKNDEGAYIDENGLPNLKDMTYEEMVKECKRGLKQYYMSRKFLLKAVTHPSLMKRILASIIPAIRFIYSKNILEVPIEKNQTIPYRNSPHKSPPHHTKP